MPMSTDSGVSAAAESPRARNWRPAIARIDSSIVRSAAATMTAAGSSRLG